MKTIWLLALLLAVSLIPLGGCGENSVTSAAPVNVMNREEIMLPEPQKDSDTSIEETLLERRSVREYSDKALTLEQLSQLLWAAQGVTDPSGKRTAPSAGALYPLKVYAVAGSVEGLAAGVYSYEPSSHSVTKVVDGDRREALARAAVGQSCVERGAIDIVIAAIYEITTVKYGERGIRYVHIEAGHAGQNICLQAVGLKLGAVTIGAFDDAGVRQALELPEDEVPLYIIPVGNLTD